MKVQPKITVARANIVNQFKGIGDFTLMQFGIFKLELMTNFNLPKWYTQTLCPEQGRKIYEQMGSKENGFGEFFFFETHSPSQLKKIITKQFMVPQYYVEMLSTDQIRDICELKLIIDQKVDFMSYHEHEVSKIIFKIAPLLGFSKEETKNLALLALFHDIGKVIAPGEFLNAAKHKLTREEKMLNVFPHSEYSAAMLSKYPILNEFTDWAKYHHKDFCGMGYPFEGEDAKIKEEKINIYARLLAIADSFHAMIDKRGYKRVKTVTEACYEIIEMAGFQFDPYLAFRSASILGGFAGKTIEYANRISHDYALPLADTTGTSIEEIQRPVYEGIKNQEIRFNAGNEPEYVHGTWKIISADCDQPAQITQYYLRGIMKALMIKNLDYSVNVFTPLCELFMNAIQHGCWEDIKDPILLKVEHLKKEIIFEYYVDRDNLKFSINYPSNEFDIEKAYAEPKEVSDHHNGLSYLVQDFVDNIDYVYEKGHYTVSGTIPLSNPKDVFAVAKMKRERRKKS